MWSFIRMKINKYNLHSKENTDWWFHLFPFQSSYFSFKEMFFSYCVKVSLKSSHFFYYVETNAISKGVMFSQSDKKINLTFFFISFFFNRWRQIFLWLSQTLLLTCSPKLSTWNHSTFDTFIDFNLISLIQCKRKQSRSFVLFDRFVRFDRSVDRFVCVVFVRRVVSFVRFVIHHRYQWECPK